MHPPTLNPLFAFISACRVHCDRSDPLVHYKSSSLRFPDSAPSQVEAPNVRTKCQTFTSDFKFLCKMVFLPLLKKEKKKVN